MREIVLDTETTGLNPKTERIIEIGCVELENRLPTGRTYWQYINPEQEIGAGAMAVHGLTNDFLADKPVFSEIVGDFLSFIGDDTPLVIHNASFDMRFLNAEMERHGFPALPMSRSLDTLAMARKKFPGAAVSLDALCRTYHIDNSNRTLHGALLDSELLAEVYLELLGGRQQSMSLSFGKGADAEKQAHIRKKREARPHAPTREESVAHEAMLEDNKYALWHKCQHDSR